MIGEKKFHQKLGTVIIKKYEDNESKAIVRDKNGKNYRVWSKSLIPINQTNQKKNNSNDFNSRKIIEALKLGGVPLNHAEKFSTGRDEEIHRIKKFLQDPNEGSLVITGDYGVGKTHLLELIRYHAISLNYVVSRVEIDSSEISFHLPKNIHREILRNMQYPKNGKILGFRELISDIFISLNFSARDKLNLHPYFSQFLLFWENDLNNEPLLELFEGR